MILNDYITLQVLGGLVTVDGQMGVRGCKNADTFHGFSTECDNLGCKKGVKTGGGK